MSKIKCQETTRRGTPCTRTATYVAEIGHWYQQHAPCVCDEECDYGPHPDCPHHGSGDEEVLQS